jgi:hypothetical protein
MGEDGNFYMRQHVQSSGSNLFTTPKSLGGKQGFPVSIHEDTSTITYMAYRSFPILRSYAPEARCGQLVFCEAADWLGGLSRAVGPWKYTRWCTSDTFTEG